MMLYNEVGVCEEGYYAGSDGITDLHSCFKQCIAEVQCSYVSFAAGKTCNRYNSYVCNIRVNHNEKLYITYQKVMKGEFNSRQYF